VGGIVPLAYFCRNNTSLLRLGKTGFDSRALSSTCTNGLSELVTNISMSVVSILYNLQLMSFAGENGVAAYGAVMYVSFIFVAVFIGFVIGSAPIFGYNHGADNRRELQNMFRKSLVILGIFAVAMSAAALFLAEPLSNIFVGYDPELMAMTVRGFRIYSLSFLLCGFNIFGSSLFTALNNGLVSAAISFVRTLICQIAAVMLLPLILGLDGIWFAIVAAELVALALTIFCFLKFKDRYHYL
jgi:Na+-driven multidrug efflux pump